MVLASGACSGELIRASCAPTNDSVISTLPPFLSARPPPSTSTCTASRINHVEGEQARVRERRTIQKRKGEPLKIIWPEMKSARAISKPSPRTSDGDVNSTAWWFYPPPAGGPILLPSLPLLLLLRRFLYPSRFCRGATDK